MFQSIVADAATGGLLGNFGGFGLLLIYVVVFGIIMYVTTVIPGRKRQKAMDAMLANLAVGDSVLTNSGFYGVIIDIAEEVVVVEFGSDKHCRIPMQKEAIVSVEKADADA